AGEMVDLASGTVVSAASAKSDASEEHLMSAVEQMALTIAHPARAQRKAETINLEPRIHGRVRYEQRQATMTGSAWLVLSGVMLASGFYTFGMVDELALHAPKKQQCTMFSTVNNCYPTTDTIALASMVPIAGPAIVEIASGRNAALGFVESGAQ